MYKVIINEQKNYDVSPDSQGIKINEQSFEWDLIPVGSNRFHVLHNNRSYNAELIEANIAEKTFQIKINQNIYSVAAKDRFDLLLEQMGMNSSAKNKVNNIKAPMPGLIWDIKVQPGDAVGAGDVVLVLVAMKMENALKSPGDGIVKAIKVSKGDSVEKNQVLIEFE